MGDVIRAARLAREPWRLRPAPAAAVPPTATQGHALEPAAAETTHREAYQAGFNSGERAGRQLALEAAERALAPRLEALDRLAAALGRALTDSAAEAEPVLVEIAFAAVCRIVGDTLASTAGVAAVVHRVIEQLPAREHLVVRLSPADHERLRSEMPALAAGDAAHPLALRSDERVALGGCLVETSGGTLDGRLETQLAQLAKALLAARAMRAGDPR